MVNPSQRLLQAIQMPQDQISRLICIVSLKGRAPQIWQRWATCLLFRGSLAATCLAALTVSVSVFCTKCHLYTSVSAVRSSSATIVQLWALTIRSCIESHQLKMRSRTVSMRSIDRSIPAWCQRERSLLVKLYDLITVLMKSKQSRASLRKTFGMSTQQWWLVSSPPKELS